MSHVDTGCYKLVEVGIQNNLRNGGLYGREIALWRVHCHQPGTGARGATGGEDGGTGHAVASGHQQDGAIVVFARKLVSRPQLSLRVFLLDEVEIALHLIDGGIVDIQVQDLALTYKLGIFSEEERQALELQSQCEVGPDYVSAVSAYVPLSEQSRRQVD